MGDVMRKLGFFLIIAAAACGGSSSSSTSGSSTSGGTTAGGTTPGGTTAGGTTSGGTTSGGTTAGGTTSGGTTDASSPRDGFLGVWSGAAVVKATLRTPLGTPTSNQSLQTTATITAGSDADSIVLDDDTGCHLTAKVAGNQAGLTEAATCTSVKGSATVVLHFQNGTLTLRDDDTLSLDAGGDVNVTEFGVQTPGTFTSTGTFTRVSH
jgi:hypothetical protein